MNDPDPSPSPIKPANGGNGNGRQNGNGASGSINGTDLAHTSPGWFARLTQGWLSKLTNTSLRSQMEGALADDEGGDETFSAEEKAMLRNILSLRELRVDDVMVPRADIDAVEDDITLGALLALYREVGHSRLPVYRETLDDPVGMVHIKDVVGFMTEECCLDSANDPHKVIHEEGFKSKDMLAMDQAESDEFEMLNALSEAQEAPQPASNHPVTLADVDLERPLKELGVIREILFVPPSMPAMDLMATMRAARTQMALVIDEYGGTDGLISLEDVVETVVGDIEDEHDDEDEVFIADAGPNLFIADARADVEEVIKTIGVPLPLDDDESMEDVDTLGGFIFTHIGRIPVRGELIAVTDGLEFEIMEADRRRIRRVKIRLKPVRKPTKRAFALSRALTDQHDEETDQASPSGSDEPDRKVS